MTLANDGLVEKHSTNWKRAKQGGNSPPCNNYAFDGVASDKDITQIQNNVGYYVGGLNCDNVTIAWCNVVHTDHMSNRGLQLCDPHIDGNQYREPDLNCT
jgi:hypothetical protein